jgi:sporulation protein YlmC with PRC-barrel domain
MKGQAPDPLRVHFHLLDRQIVDRDGNPVGKVDDVELDADPTTGVVRLTALLSGQRVLGGRIGGLLGRWMASIAWRLASQNTPTLRIDVSVIDDIGSAITLNIRRELLATPPLEAWLGQHVIGRIPGARDAGQ